MRRDNIVHKRFGAMLLVSVLVLGCAGARGQESAGDQDDQETPVAGSGVAQREHVRHMRAHKKPSVGTEAASQAKATAKNSGKPEASQQSRKPRAGARKSHKSH